MSLETNHMNWRQNPFTSLVTWEHYTEHDHTFWELILIIHGRANHIVNGKSTVIGRGDFILLRPSDKHYFKLLEDNYKHRDIYVTYSDMTEICKNINPEILTKIINAEDPLCCKLDDISIEYIDQFCSKYQDIVDFGKDSMTKNFFNAFTQHALCILFDSAMSSNQIPKWLADFLFGLTDEDIMNKSVSELVEKTGYSHTHFCRLFKQYMKQTFSNYIAGIKIDYSLKLLCDKNLSILDISSLLGYDSLSHYITSFKNRFGLTPNKYRKNRL